MKTIVALVDCESATWMRGGAGLLDGVILCAPKIFPFLSLDEKVAMAKQLLGQDIRKPKVHKFSTLIGATDEDDLVAVQFFDVEEQSTEHSINDLEMAFGKKMEEDEDEDEDDEDEDEDDEDEDD